MLWYSQWCSVHYSGYVAYTAHVSVDRRAVGEARSGQWQVCLWEDQRQSGFQW